MNNRSIIMGGIWAEDAPDPVSNPVQGITYANSGLTESGIINGQGYNIAADSAKWNEILKRITGLLTLLEKCGILPWSPSTSYNLDGLCIASDGNLYKSLSDANEGHDPTSASGYWGQSIADASSSTPGITQYATYEETLTGSTGLKSVTPYSSLLANIGPWTNFSLLNGWTATRARWRVLNYGKNIQIEFYLCTGKNATNTTISNFNNDYRPISNIVSIVAMGNSSGTSYDIGGTFQVDTAGGIEGNIGMISGGSAANYYFSINQILPLI